MKLRRLAQMDATELICRGRQATWKWVERMAAAARAPAGWGPAPGAGIDLDGRSSDPRRFFPGAVQEETARLLWERMPAACEAIITSADGVCQGRFDLLGYRGLEFGWPPDWHLDPISGRRAPQVHWTRLDPLDFATVGDSKVVWELNRHQWLVHLGQAYQLTRDERYADAFVLSLQEWTRGNPRGIGLNWTSSLEVALRLISWCWALQLFRSSTRLSPELWATLRTGISAHASHVERYLSYYFSPNTHLTGEALGLVYAGVVFPELPRAGRWMTLGTRVLTEQSERQIFADGVYFEQSTCYQRYATEIYLHLLILCDVTGWPVHPGLPERVQRALDFLIAVRAPDGAMPAIGDADGGWLLPLAVRAPQDLRGVLSVAAAVFHRPDYAAAAGDLAPETLWLLGRAAVDALEALPATAPAVLHRLFADGGYAVLRSTPGAAAHQLVFDVGPLGGLRAAGHGHADLLSLQCWAFGEPYLQDPGTYCYTADPEWRDFFRSSAAHSTAVIDGENQALPAGPFGWSRPPRARLLRWVSGEGFQLVAAEHDAYARLAGAPVHRRAIVFVCGQYWIVLDDFRGKGEHRVDVQFQFAPLALIVEPTLWACAWRSEGRRLQVKAFSAVPLKVEVREGEVAPIRGWVSPDYGQRQPAPLLTYSTVSRLPLRIMTVLLPSDTPGGGPPAVRPLAGQGGEPVGVAFEDGWPSVRVDDGGLVTVSPTPTANVDARARGRSVPLRG
jgi:hypothetical protein